MRLLIWHEHQTPPGQGGGGAESMLRDQTEALHRLGHTVAWLQSSQIEEAVRRFTPDMVQVQTIHNAFGVEPVTWLQENDIPHVWVLMDYWPFCGGRMLLKNWDEGCAAVDGVCDGQCAEGKANPRLLEVVNGSPVIALNRFTADIYRRNGLRCDGVVELGVDTNFFCLGERDAEVSVYTSSAWAPYPAKGMKYLKEAIEGMGINVNLMTNVTREQIAQGLKRAHIFVFPSTYQETWGLCLQEAMASGCACIASDVAGARAQIEHGVTGILVPPRDPNALRGALQWLLKDNDKREELGRNARDHSVADHNLEAMGRRWANLYTEVQSGFQGQLSRR